MKAMDRINAQVGKGYAAIRGGGDSTVPGNEKGGAVKEIYDGMGGDVEGERLKK